MMRECLVRLHADLTSITVSLAKKSYQLAITLLSLWDNGSWVVFPDPVVLPIPWDADGGNKQPLT